MNTIALTAAAAVVLFITAAANASAPMATTREVVARYLRPADFYRAGVDWLPRMDPQLVHGLELFFAAVAKEGGQAMISAHEEALGRTNGNNTSQHYFQPGGRVRAADVMVSGIPLQRAYTLARNLGVFSGIGLYPEWKPYPGLHLDTRTTRAAIDPATWSRINGSYVGIEAALA